MVKSELVSEYAIAIYELANETNKQKQIRNDLTDVLECFKTEDEFYSVIKSNQISSSEKKELINKVFKSSISKLVLDAISYVLDQNDEKELIDILKRTIELLDNNMGIINIKIYSSFELKPSDINKIGEKIKQKTNKEPVFKVIIDKSLIGGIKVCYEDTVLDNSIKNKLSVIRNEMRKGKNYESK